MQTPPAPSPPNPRLAPGNLALILLVLTAASVPAAGDETPVYHVSPATSEIVIDGVLDEPAWGSALSVALDYEVQPGENVSPPVNTDCLVTYDERHVYFAFRALDPDPSRIRARYTDRDEAWNDDWVGIVLDTFNDERRAYELFSNPLGVQIDAINDDVAGNYDDSWNAMWKSAGRITDDGYEVEMAIPFSQIRFQAREGKQTWGFDALRSYPRGHRHHIGLFPRDRGNNSYLSQAVKLVGMDDVSPGKNFEVIPTLTAARDDEAVLPDGSLEEVDSRAELGVSVRWGITSNLSLNGALNPDFSQVEADAVQLDVNEQFALFFPETRTFFLEGADYFNTQLNLVHTRNVADPSAAVKLTNKQGRHTTGIFLARDDQTNVIFPGADGSSADIFDHETSDLAGRYRFDFGTNSTVGATVTDRSGSGYSNLVVSADTVYRATDADTLSLSYARSRTEYSREMIDAFDDPDEPDPDLATGIDDSALALDYSHGVRGWWTHLSYNDFGEDYRSDLGFRPQVDFARWSASGARVWWGEDGRFFNRLALGGQVTRSETQAGSLLQEDAASWINYRGPRQTNGGIRVTARNRVFDGVEFDQQFAYLWFNTQPSGSWRLSFEGEIGDGIDFDNTRPGDRLFLRPGFRFNVGRHLVVRYDHTFSSLDVDGGQLFRVHAPEARVIYQFNNRAFVRAILQYTDIERDPALYFVENEADRPDAESRDLLAQLLFSYKLGPETAIYVGYTDTYEGDQDYRLTESTRTLFLKLSYAWAR